MVFVLDASCVLALAFDEPVLSRIPDLHTRIVSDGVCVPPIWKWEVANGFVQAARRDPANAEHLIAQLLSLEQLPIAIDGESLERAWGATLILAMKHRLTPYDAAYLELAVRARLSLASFDRALVEAARRENIEVISA